MAFEQRMIGQMTAELMEEAERQYGDEAEIRLAAMIVAVEHGEQTTYHWRFRPQGNLPHEALGLLEYVSRQIASPRP
jgi:hypothetical protein